MNEKQENWHSLLPLIVSAYNNMPHDSTCKSPYEVIFGRQMSNPFNIGIKQKNISDNRITELADKSNLVWENLKTLTHISHEKQAKQYNKNVKTYTFQKGDKIWLRNERVLLHKSKKKLTCE